MCDRVRELLGRWYDGELDELTAHRVAGHVKTCARCQAEVRRWRQIDRLLDCRLAEGDSSLVASVLQRIATEDRPAGQSWWLRLAAAGLLAAALGGVGGWMTAADHQQPLAAGEPISLTLLDQSFAPERQSRLDELATELGVGLRGRL